MSRTLTVRDERSVREVVKIESEWKEHHGRDDDAYDDRVRATKTRVRDLERRSDRREDRDLRDPMQRIRAVDDQRIHDSAVEESGRESDDREHARVAHRIAERKQQTEAEGEEHGGDHPFA